MTILSYKVKLNTSPEQYIALEKTGSLYQQLYNSISAISWQHKIKAQFKIHDHAYYQCRKEFPEAKSQMIIRTIAQVSGAIQNAVKHVKAKNELQCPKKRNANNIYLDQRLSTINKNSIRISTTSGIITIPFRLRRHLEKNWKYLKSGCNIKKRGKDWYLTLHFDFPAAIKSKDSRVLGIDRGISNVAVCSNNKFFNSKKIKNIKGCYQFKRSQLQAKGTKSAKRKLKAVSGKDNRFVRDTNHCISKQVVAFGFGIVALEKLNIKKQKKLGKNFNKKLGRWSFFQLEEFIKYKAELAGLSVVKVPASYTSQDCSKCGYREKKNRKGFTFKCKKCDFEVHADLNAARNIAARAKCLSSRLLSISQTEKELNSFSNVSETSVACF